MKRQKAGTGLTLKNFSAFLRRDGQKKHYVLGFFLGLFTIIQLYPLIWLVLFSFKDNMEIFGGNVLGLPHRLLWQNYNQALFSGKVGLYFVNSCLVTGATILISGLLSAMASYAITRMKWKLSKITLTIFLLGLMLPIHAALLPLFVILRNMHLLNTYWALIIPYVAFAMPMAIFIFSGFLQLIPRELEESACLDGCNIYQIFFKIVFPLIKPAVATVSIFTYLSAWNELMFAVTFISKQEFRTLTVGIMSLAGQYTTEWGPIGAGLVVATLPTILVYSLMSDQVQKSLTAGALKG
ncbi:raffinose/stachyose/melibiose transport system permease protein [Hydrogenispora ethanolica]|uniref:Raffinose/stachyose/melibiose transport system permease protein n=1 Tax=Hydrogenispora ethanolica TaxID=1082276 RepID=A0A4R1RYC2_HYDET|nr:raffinose/stachyose/melibiose transport system permease protein [Hydrogenispora ethanolica]